MLTVRNGVVCPDQSTRKHLECVLMVKRKGKSGDGKRPRTIEHGSK